MNSDLQEFISARLPFPGLAAWAARYPDRTLAQQRFTGSLTPAQVEQALGFLAPGADSLSRQGLQPERLCWVFEHLRIYLALRSDGTCLALFVENRPDRPTATIESVLEDFTRNSALK